MLDWASLLLLLLLLFLIWEDPYYVERVIIYNFKLVYHLRYKVKISILLQASTF